MQNLGVVAPITTAGVDQPSSADNVAQPPSAEDAAQPAPVQYVCPECGRACKNPKSLGIHRRFSHGVKGMSNRQRAAKHRGAKQLHPSPRLGNAKTAALPLDSLFEFAAAQMQAQADLVVSCVRGLSLILEQSKKLRAQYLKVRHELTKLQRAAASSKLETEGRP